MQAVSIARLEAKKGNLMLCSLHQDGVNTLGRVGDGHLPGVFPTGAAPTGPDMILSTRFDELFSREVLLLQNVGRPAVDESHRIVKLMIFRHIRGRDQQGGLALRLQFADGDRSARPITRSAAAMQSGISLMYSRMSRLGCALSSTPFSSSSPGNHFPVLAHKHGYADSGRRVRSRRSDRPPPH